jgi:tetratricopeptide (TPR) repeat protein
VHDIAFLSAERGALRAAVVGYRASIKLLRKAGHAGIATTMIAMARALGELGDRGGRVRYAQRAIAHSARHGEDEEEARAWLALAEAYADQGKSRRAREAQERAIVLLRNKGDYRTLARALNDLGAAHHDDGHLHLALRYLLRGLWWDQQIDNREGLGSGLSNIAWLHWEAAEGMSKTPIAKEASLRKSEEYFSQAIAVQRAVGNKLQVARLLAYRSMTLSGLDQNEQALRDLRRALPTLRAHRDETSIAVALNNRGTIEEKLGRSSIAIRSYETAIEHAERGLEVGIRRTARANLGQLTKRLKEEAALHA